MGADAGRTTIRTKKKLKNKITNEYPWKKGGDCW